MMNHCVSCDRTFSSRQTLKQHLKTSQKHGGTFRCGPCKRPFSNEKALKQHQRDSPSHQHAMQSSPPRVVPTPQHEPTLSPGNAQAVSVQHVSPRSDQTTSQNFNVESALAQISLVDVNDVHVGARTKVTAVSNGKVTLGWPKKSTKPVARIEEETRTFFMFPDLHQSVAEAVAPEIASPWFNHDYEDEDFSTEYSTCIMGTFTCNNSSCKKRSWGSMVVAIVIRGYERYGYTAMVFNQRCNSCEHLGTLKMDQQTYIERVAYRLKKWAGVAVARPRFKEKIGPPHEKEFCEGCKRGLCPQTVNVTHE